MDSLTLLERSYRKSRHTVDGEWQDKFRWCFGGDGGGGGDGDGGGMDVDSLSTDAPGMSAAEAEASGMDVDSLSTDAPGKSADQAAMDEAASMQSGFAGFGLSGLPGPGEEEDSYGYTGVPDYETGLVDPAANLDSQASFSETFGRTPAQALAGFADPSILGRVASLALGPTGLGLNALTSGILSTGVVEGAKMAGAPESLTTGLMEQAGFVDPAAPSISDSLGLSNLGYNTMSPADLAAEQAAQQDYASQMANGGVVRLQNGIGSLYGRR